MDILFQSVNSDLEILEKLVGSVVKREDLLYCGNLKVLKSNIDRLSLDGVAHFRPDWNDACKCRGELVQKEPIFMNDPQIHLILGNYFLQVGVVDPFVKPKRPKTAFQLFLCESVP